ncbi:hypothetical protein F5ESL0260_03385 [Lactobacillus sp. ESL0260]|uniref:hypothetical protein n=1 Tax=Lactobacillus sp. ESL0260 TaxID=2069347 RepID=UPI000EFD44DE|nr:hypothetical protein [Lactobacillus sp. ESL0260]RMC58800.1 hypothetical protein F5ESL0260_03385 [Lactobacillus sp. ESL0260]
MSFWGIVGLVLLAVVILSVIFAIFHIFFMILPAALVIIGIIWLINHFTKNDDNNVGHSDLNSGSYSWDNWNENNETKPKRKKVRDAKTKDVDK